MFKKFDYSLRGVQYTDEELRDLYEADLNVDEEPVVSVGRVFGAGQVLRKLDEKAFNYAYSVWLDGLIRSGEARDLNAARATPKSEQDWLADAEHFSGGGDVTVTLKSRKFVRDLVLTPEQMSVVFEALSKVK